MSLPKVPSSKVKDLHDGVSSFERVSRLFKEIESFIESELADTPSISASYEIPRMKSKRKRGPYLIKPLNKSKARKTLNEMEYDPVRMEWAGNQGVLKSFAGGRPALISNKANSFRPESGKMVWNAKEQKWDGNYDDLRAFEKRVIPAIKHFKNDGVPRVINGMSFNPVKMTWEGNSEVLGDFGFTEDLGTSIPQDDGFAVGTEFQLSQALTRQFTECAARHAIETGGWWRDEKAREFLSVIRTMSIMRLVRDAKRAAFAFEEPSFMDIVPNEKNNKLKSPHAETEVDFDDAWDELAPFDGTVKLKVPDAISDLDQELNNFGTVSAKNGKMVPIDEDWDNDFADDLKKILPKKVSSHRPSIPSFEPLLNTTTPPLPSTSSSSSSSSSPVPSTSTSSSSLTPSISSVFNGKVTKLGKGGSAEIKPFAMLKADDPHRRSFYDLKIAKGPKLAWDDDEEDGLEIPVEPLRLKLNRSSSVASSDGEAPEADDFDDNDEETPAAHQPEEEDVFEEENSVEEEDWNDVELPPTATLGEPVTLRPQQPTYQPPEKEEWDDFEITPEKLELKLSQRKSVQQPQQTSNHKKHYKKADEEELDGLDIPDGVPLRLKR